VGGGTHAASLSEVLDGGVGIASVDLRNIANDESGPKTIADTGICLPSDAGNVVGSLISEHLVEMEFFREHVNGRNGQEDHEGGGSDQLDFHGRLHILIGNSSEMVVKTVVRKEAMTPTAVINRGK
jgi:hypothetical protein